MSCGEQFDWGGSSLRVYRRGLGPFGTCSTLPVACGLPPDPTPQSDGFLRIPGLPPTQGVPISIGRPDIGVELDLIAAVGNTVAILIAGECGAARPGSRLELGSRGGHAPPAATSEPGRASSPN